MRDFLESARANGTLVELQLEAPDASTLLGWVVGLGEEWVVVHQVNDGLWLDGYVAVPLATVDAYRDRDATDDGFVRLVAAARGYGPAEPSGLDASGTAELLASLTTGSALVSLDFADDESLFSEIGELVSADAETATLRTIGTDARWQGLEDVALAGLRGVTVGDGYLEALAIAARD